jgi:ankyrin repeat protein
MKPTALILTLLLPLVPACATTPTPAPTPPPAAQDEEGWKAFGHALTLAQVLMGIAARSENPEQGFDDVLAGRSTEANRAMAGLLEEATADMPSEYRSRVASIGQDIASLARKQVGKPMPTATSAAVPSAASSSRALQARKDLTAMGLKYHDTNEFLAAVSRDDALAVGLFIEGRGVNLAAKDAQGRTAQEIARARGNEPMAQLLARSLPAAR